MERDRYKDKGRHIIVRSVEVIRIETTEQTQQMNTSHLFLTALSLPVGPAAVASQSAPRLRNSNGTRTGTVTMIITAKN
jgi:hypothetical protein